MVVESIQLRAMRMTLGGSARGLGLSMGETRITVHGNGRYCTQRHSLTKALV